MTRYFIEVAYRGGNYAGFQRQENAHTVQQELEQVIFTVTRSQLKLTGSSRTDAGVHARQNYFHFDVESPLRAGIEYNLNAMLPDDLSVRRIVEVGEAHHSRFDAVSREYRYHIYRQKDPFLSGRAFYFPYTLDFEILQQAAGVLKEYGDFTSFSKRNTQVKTFRCQLIESRWEETPEGYSYYVKGNRFLRGMVRALTATMLRAGRSKLDIAGLRKIIEMRDCTKADFAVPAHGLYLERVNYPLGHPACDDGY
ncbi:tRNA pseudouridine(38-40) synthase TruA [Flavihumibacter solisilvae]|uniref:tRNA pseudouridine synthase A n=1 Tax=Flavihumibacter solisilvae TaxID=1349421 RepID=A0A0C1I9J1_9BACT|nr:tRNA pseudouridine(38-40) synthase TruA [Flavihumibacter solisilvae]KIC90680.1 pseudouridine synthase [Flavihumibacter solisilvae]